MAFSPSNETRPRYGQVYRTAAGPGHDMSFRATLWVDNGGVYRPLWEGKRFDNPEASYEDMVEMAPRNGVTDLRRWSGEWPPQRSEP